MDEVVSALEWVKNREWVVTLATVYAVASVVLDQADILPDGTAKTWVLAVAALVVAAAQRAGVWSKATVDEITQT